MAKPKFVKFEVSKELSDKAYEAVSTAKAGGKIRIGVNEVTKAIERGTAKLVVLAEDVTPEEVVMHIPILCDEKKVTYIFVPSKAELGRSSGISVPASSIVITEEGESKKLLDEISKKFAEIKK